VNVREATLQSILGGRGLSRRRSLLPLAALAFGIALAARPAWAQLPDASGAALGLGDNYTALARGRNAVAWNPAGLAMPGSPKFSLAIAPARAVGALGPIGPRDLAQIGDRALTFDEKVSWLERIQAGGGQRGAIGADVTYLSLNVGRIGLQLSSSVDGALNLGPDAAELLLFGNAGRTGSPRPFAFDGSSFDVAGTSTAALSYGHPIAFLPGQNLAVGVTVKYTVGHILYSGRDQGSRFNDDPLGGTIAFPVIHTDTAISNWNNGAGYGIDLGAAWQSGPLTVGLALKNVVNTFAWDESKLFFRPGSAVISVDSTTSDFDSRPIESAPAELRARARALVDDFRYRPHIALGASVHPLPMLTLVGELRHRRGELLDVKSATHAGLGAEFRPLRWIPFRGGYTLLPGGHQWSGGVGLELGVLNLQLSAARRNGGAGEGGIGMFVLSFGGR
jgi:hypothetical protein